jgi:hypothetical protein
MTTPTGATVEVGWLYVPVFGYVEGGDPLAGWN